MKGSNWVATSISLARSLPTREVGGHMALDLRFATAQCDEHGKGQQLADGQVEAAAGHVVAEAVCRQVVLDVDQILGGVRVHGVDRVGADDLLLHDQALVLPVLRAGGGLRGQRQGHATLGEHLVGDVQKSNTFAMPTYGTAW